MPAIDCILFKSAEKMNKVKNGAAQLVIISPPYVGHHSQAEKDAEQSLLERLFAECARILTPDGVVASVNTDFRDKGMLYARHIAVINAARKAGLVLKDEKIWVRGFRRNIYRKNFTFVLIFSKQKKIVRAKNPAYETDNWVFVKKQKVLDFSDAIAPEIPIILIRTFTKQDDLVVSACAGSGTVVIAALREGRRTVGYEINPKMKRIIRYREKHFESYFSPHFSAAK